MRNIRLYCPEIKSSMDEIIITDEKFHYIAKVLRAKINYNCSLFNNSDGNEYNMTISDIAKKNLTLKLEHVTTISNESNLNITIAQAISKGNKIEQIIKTATELGVKSIIPILSKRVDYKPDIDKYSSKIDHWQKIAISASEQSGRVFFPKIHNITTLKKCIENTDELKLVLSPFADNSLKETLNNVDKTDNITVFIGPEGGFNEQEIIDFCDNNCKQIKIGPRILRTETAPLVICSILNAAWGDF